MNRNVRIIALILVCFLTATACTTKSGRSVVKIETYYKPDTSLMLPTTVAYAVKEAIRYTIFRTIEKEALSE